MAAGRTSDIWLLEALCLDHKEVRQCIALKCGAELHVVHAEPVTLNATRGSGQGVGYVAYGLAASLGGVSITVYSRIRSLRFGASETNSTLG